MKTFAPTVLFFLTLILTPGKALATDSESTCSPKQYLNSVDSKYVTPTILRRSYRAAYKHFGQQVDGDTVVIHYPFSEDQSTALHDSLSQWGVHTQALRIVLTVSLGPQRTQLILSPDTADTEGFVRLDYILRDEAGAVMVFASAFAPEGQMTCVEYTKMQQFFWDEVFMKILTAAYPDGFPVTLR